MVLLLIGGYQKLNFHAVVLLKMHICNAIQFDYQTYALAVNIDGTCLTLFSSSITVERTG